MPTRPGTTRAQRHLAPVRAQHYLPPESRSRPDLTTHWNKVKLYRSCRSQAAAIGTSLERLGFV